MQNGTEVKMEDSEVHSDDYNFLVEYGIAKNVAAELEKIYATGNQTIGNYRVRNLLKV